MPAGVNGHTMVIRRQQRLGYLQQPRPKKPDGSTGGKEPPTVAARILLYVDPNQLTIRQRPTQATRPNVAQVSPAPHALQPGGAPRPRAPAWPPPLPACKRAGRGAEQR